jgi:site-specific recombinase XerD
MQPDVGTRFTPDDHATDLVPSLHERAALIAKSADPNITIERAAATYKLAKRKRLTAASQRGYEAILDDFTAGHSGLLLRDFDSVQGAAMVEQHLAERYGLLAPRTYNKGLSVLVGFFGWYSDRATIGRNPAKTIEPAKPRAIHRRTFTDSEVIGILTSNKAPRDQIALRLLLFFGIRKGALRGISSMTSKPEARELTIFTKGEKIQTLQIVDDAIWELLDELREPGNHYLLPKRKTRKRVPPQRAALQQLSRRLRWLTKHSDAGRDDDSVAVELADVLDCETRRTPLTIAVDAASTRVNAGPTDGADRRARLPSLVVSLPRPRGVVAPGATAGRRLHSARHTAIQRIVDKTGTSEGSPRRSPATRTSARPPSTTRGPLSSRPRRCARCWREYRGRRRVRRPERQDLPSRQARSGRCRFPSLVRARRGVSHFGG